jgi:hypothetical protein
MITLNWGGVLIVPALWVLELLDVGKDEEEEAICFVHHAQVETCCIWTQQAETGAPWWRWRNCLAWPARPALPAGPLNYVRKRTSGQSIQTRHSFIPPPTLHSIVSSLQVTGRDDIYLDSPRPNDLGERHCTPWQRTPSIEVEWRLWQFDHSSLACTSGGDLLYN